MMKPKLLKPPMPYLWEFLISEPCAVPMKEAKKFIQRQIFNCIEDATKVRIYIRIEKEAGKERRCQQDAVELRRK